ncbi:MAG: hypothetical protein OXI87_22270 [Albidovulum sp.]|nr:hypothetical protein [Albidovulum sp.]MDE0307581.1 hypothetical protein [Albidovulum sp.]MDE0533048.1 hypothetical protein [Albidovulum sp.]
MDSPAFPAIGFDRDDRYVHLGRRRTGSAAKAGNPWDRGNDVQALARRLKENLQPL